MWPFTILWMSSSPHSLVMVLTIQIRIEINNGVPYKRKRKYKRSKNIKIIVSICTKIDANDNIANKGFGLEANK